MDAEERRQAVNDGIEDAFTRALEHAAGMEFVDSDEILADHTVAVGYLTLTTDMPFGQTEVMFRVGGQLYVAGASHHPQVKDGEIVADHRFLEVKVRRVG